MYACLVTQSAVRRRFLLVTQSAVRRRFLCICKLRKANKAGALRRKTKSTILEERYATHQHFTTQRTSILLYFIFLIIIMIIRKTKTKMLLRSIALFL